MKVTIDGITYEGSEDEIERVVKKHGVVVTNAYASPDPHSRRSDWAPRENPGDPR